MRRYTILIIFFCLCFISWAHAQSQEIDSDTLSNIIMNADTVYHASLGPFELDTLIGHVVLTQDSLVMYCKRAIVIDQIDAKAYEDVVIIHQDTIQIFADSMLYHGITKIAELYGEVILLDGTKRLYTTELEYNVDQKTAVYTNGGTLIDGVDTILSKEGYYFQKEKRVRLKGNVSYQDSVRRLYTDSILYLYDLDQLNIIAPTRIFQDSVDIYCEVGLFRPKADRGVLSNNVQVRSDSQLITSGILDIKGQDHTYTFLIDPEVIDEDRYARADTIIYFEDKGLIELRSDAFYRSPSERMEAPVITYNRGTDVYSTRGRAKVHSDHTIIEADEIIAEASDVTRLVGKVTIAEEDGSLRIESQEALKSGKSTKMYNAEGQPLLTYELGTDPLLLMGDTLISTEEVPTPPTTIHLPAADSMTVLDTALVADKDSSPVYNTDPDSTSIDSPTAETQQLFYALDRVRMRNGDTYGSSGHFVFNQSDSIITMIERPIIWSDSTQLTGDTIKIYLRNNEVYKISLINNALIVSPDSAGMYNQIKGTHIDNYIDDKALQRADVHGNAELFYMIKEGESYRGINLTKSQSMTFIFEGEQISKILMSGQPESNMYEYKEEMDLSSYYLKGFTWRIEERPQKHIFRYNGKSKTKLGVE